MTRDNGALLRYSAICDFFQGINADAESSRPATTLRRASPTSRCNARGCQFHHTSNTTLWKRSLHASHYYRKEDASHFPLGEKRDSGQQESEASNNKDPQTKPKPTTEPVDTSYLENYSRLFRQLAQSVPHIHRPTRDDLLSVTNSFWKRLGIRFKWLTIRSFRKFNADDISAFFSFAIMGQTLWIFIGT